MKQVWKYALDLSPTVQRIDMPAGAEILHVADQGRNIQMWALVELDRQPEARFFAAIKTGQNINPKFEWEYAGTALTHINEFAWHVFEMKAGY